MAYAAQLELPAHIACSPGWAVVAMGLATPRRSAPARPAPGFRAAHSALGRPAPYFGILSQLG